MNMYLFSVKWLLHIVKNRAAKVLLHISNVTTSEAPIVPLCFLNMNFQNCNVCPQMVLVLKKEVVKTNNAVEHEDTGKYRQLLVRTLHQCSIKFPDVAASVIPVVSEHFCTEGIFCVFLSVMHRPCAFHFFFQI